MDGYRLAPERSPREARLLDRLSDDMARHAERGVAAPLFGRANLAGHAPPLHAAAFTGYHAPATSCDNVALAPFRCGEGTGLLLVVCGGNYKDEGCGAAAAVTARAFLDAFSFPQPASVDIPPALRRAVLTAHEAVFALSQEPLFGRVLHTVMNRRYDLRGIGTCVTAVAVLPDRVFTAHLGDGSAYLVRDGAPRKLTIEHTLANDPLCRAALHEPMEADFARSVVLRVLGVSDECPAFDVARADLSPGDRVVIGNGALCTELCAAELPALADVDASAACQALMRSMWSHVGAAPATVGVIDVSRGSC